MPTQRIASDLGVEQNLKVLIIQTTPNPDTYVCVCVTVSQDTEAYLFWLKENLRGLAAEVVDFFGDFKPSALHVKWVANPYCV